MSLARGHSRANLKAHVPKDLARDAKQAAQPLLRSVLMCLLLALAPNAAMGGLFVSTAGNDAGPGTIESPWRTIAASLNKLAPGDTLYVREGAYFEQSVASIGGTALAPIVVRSYPGEQGILDSSYEILQTPGNAGWELVDASLGEYRSTFPVSTAIAYGYIAGIPGYENERVALVPYADSLDFRATTDVYNLTAFYVGPGTYVAPDGRLHVRLAKTSDMVAAEARYGQVFAVDQPNPADYSMVISQAPYTLRVSASYLVFLDLTLNQAKQTIDLGPNVHDVRFERLTAWMGNRTIEAASTNIHDITITRSRLYGDNPRWVFWSDMKNAPAPADWLRGTSVDLRNGTHDWEIAYNHIRGSGQDLIGTRDSQYNISIHHNRLENCGDDALELEGDITIGRIEVFDNYIANGLTAIAPGQSTPNFEGPLLLYRNVMVFLREPPVNRREGINTWNGGGRFGFEYMFKHGAGPTDNSQNAHYYHNTMIMLSSAGAHGFNLIPKTPADCRIANNLLIMVNGIVNGPYRTGPGFVMDGDLYRKINDIDTLRLVNQYDTVQGFSAATGLEVHGLGDIPKRGTDPLFETFALDVIDRLQKVWALTPVSERWEPADFLLSDPSPARDAAIDIPTHPVLGTLPDTRVARDLGAIPYGTAPESFAIFPFDPALEPDDLPTLTIDDVAADESDVGGSLLIFTVRLSHASEQFVTVGYATVDGSASTADGDYQPMSATLTIPPLSLTGTIAVPVLGDRRVENDESFFVALSNAFGARLADGAGTGTIVNDDQTPAVTVLQPNGGEVMLIDASTKIGWNASHPSGIDSVTIELSRDLGMTYETIAGSLPNTGTYEWLVSAPPTSTTTEPSHTALVRIKAYDRAVNVGMDVSDAPFAIQTDVSAGLLSLFRAAPVDEGVELRWQFGPTLAVERAWLERSETSSGPWTVIAGEQRSEDDVTVLWDRSALAGRAYVYRLQVTMEGGAHLTFGPITAVSGQPIREFALASVWPNPTTGTTRIDFDVAREAEVTLAIFDVQGRVLAVLAEGAHRPGRYQATWNGRVGAALAAPGIYFVRYQTPATRFVRRLAITR